MTSPFSPAASRLAVIGGMLLILLSARAVAQTVEYDFVAHPEVFDEFRPGSGDPTDVASIEANEGLVIPRNDGINSRLVDYAQNDFTATTQLRFLNDAGKTDWASLFFRDPRLDGTDEGYSASFSNSGQLLILRINQITNQTTHGTADTELDPLVGDIMLQATVIGSTIRMTAWQAGLPKPEPQLVVTDGNADPFLENRFVRLVNSSFDPAPGASVVFRSLTLEAVPEPNSGLLFVFGMIALGGTRRRR